MNIKVTENSDCICVSSENFILTLWLENNLWLMTIDGKKDEPLFFTNFKRAMDHAEKLLVKMEDELEQREWDLNYAALVSDRSDAWKDERIFQ